MSILALIFLAIIWAVYLGWYATQSRSHRRSGDSIASFQSQLAVLERRSPGNGSRDYLGTVSGNLPLAFGRPGARSQRGVVGRSSGAAGGFAPSATAFGARTAAFSSSRAASAPKLSGARKRRRDVLVGLLGTAGATLVLGILPPLRALWLVHLLVDGVLVAYVVMLIQIRNQAAERELKVRFLPTATPLPSMMHREQAPALRRAAVN